MVPICLPCHLCFICSLSYSRKKKFPFRIIVNINHDLKLNFSLAVMLSWTQLWQNSAKVSCMLQIIILTLYLYQCYSKIFWFIDWMKLPNVPYLCMKKLFKTCTVLSFNVQLLIFSSTLMMLLLLILYLNTKDRKAKAQEYKEKGNDYFKRSGV